MSLGIMFLLDTKLSFTGASIGSFNPAQDFSPIMGILLVLVSIIIFAMEENLEEKLPWNIQKAAVSHKWTLYHINQKLQPSDRIGGYLNKPQKHGPKKITPIQERIERWLNYGRLIIPYIKKSDEKDEKRQRAEACEQVAVNRKDTYEEQFYEPHAAGGARVIDVESHITRNGKNKGRLFHFGELANGKYVWVIDKKGNFIIGNRGDYNEKSELVGMIHDMPQMTPNLGDGIAHPQFDMRKTALPHPTLARGWEVYGAGEVTIKDGLILEYNADSGHYVKLEADIGGPHEPENFVNQSIKTFKYLSRKAGWKQIKGGAKFNTKYKENQHHLFKTK